MQCQNPSRMQFSKDFLWGASVAAHQVEGGLHNQWTVWEHENAQRLAENAQREFGYLPHWQRIAKEATDPLNYISGSGVAHYERYEDDFQLLKELHMNAFRFGIEWSRIQPEEDVWDDEAVAYYRTYLRKLRSEGITPVVTLFHFTLPVWFAKKGGFEKRRNAHYFLRYVQRLLGELGDELSYIITINEPSIYTFMSYLDGAWPPNRRSKWLVLKVLHNLIWTHRQLYRMTRRRSQWKVSMAHNVSYNYAGDNSLLSRAAARMKNYMHNDYIIRRVRRYSDFIGVNYYFANRLLGLRIHNPNEQMSDLGWDMQPQYLGEIIYSLHRKHGLPVMVTENGLADANDVQRQWWIEVTLGAMHDAMNRGAQLIGYLHWSLLDNFEWDKGYWPRFGLVAVNRTTMQRTVRPSARWFAGQIDQLTAKK